MLHSGTVASPQERREPGLPGEQESAAGQFRRQSATGRRLSLPGRASELAQPEASALPLCILRPCVILSDHTPWQAAPLPMARRVTLPVPPQAQATGSVAPLRPAGQRHAEGGKSATA